jgi:phage baseplate assembly protein gpV
MYNIFRTVIFILVVSIFNISNADTFYGDMSLKKVSMDSIIINGQSNLKESKFKSIVVNGYLKFEELIVSDLLDVNGLLKGINLDCKALDVDGSVKVKKIKVNNVRVTGEFYANDAAIAQNLTVDGAIEGRNINVAGKTTLVGELDVRDSNFQVIDIISEECTLDSTTTKNITFKKPSTIFKTEKLVLKGNSTVAGDVVFESGKGEIYLYGDSTITGQVKGGTIVKKAKI